MRVKRSSLHKKQKQHPLNLDERTIGTAPKFLNLPLFVPLFISCCFTFIILISLISPTGASFNDIEIIKNSLNAKWEIPETDEWDKSSLSFDGSTAGGNCNEVFTTFLNSGEDMTSSTWIYYLYKVNKQGKISGDPVDTGVIPPVKAGESGTITSNTVEENTSYRFIVRRPLGHPAKNKQDESGYTYITSDNIIHIELCEQNLEGQAQEKTEKEDEKKQPFSEGKDNEDNTTGPNLDEPNKEGDDASIQEPKEPEQPKQPKDPIQQDSIPSQDNQENPVTSTDTNEDSIHPPPDELDENVNSEDNNAVNEENRDNESDSESVTEVPVQHNNTEEVNE